ncbi:MAG: 50S ribosomal protein L13 [Thermotoga sp.]|nr:MAG: 50S ribosomal protein L13 [Thermotoga sp.]HDM70740.1 50S ribosomal protein L13 [Thermotogales bacterium]
MENKTRFFKRDEIDRKWYLVDAEGKVLGRLASRIALLLQGKHKPVYSPNVDGGDYVVVVNCDKVVLTGKKLKEKKYYSHSGYIGNLKVRTAEQLLKKHPEKLIYLAVKGMLPKNKLRKKMLRKLKIYSGPDHPHQAQKPVLLNLD